MRRFLDAIRTLFSAPTRDQQAREEETHLWGPDYAALAERARRLGWDGTGSLWRLCAWADVSSDGCAEHRREAGIRRALASVQRVIERREQEADEHEGDKSASLRWN